MNPSRKIRVLIVDDSVVVRRILKETISAEPDLEVVGAAPDPYVARDMILEHKPDVLTLDIEMPRMDGLTFLRKLMQYHPMPVLVISSLAQASCQAALEALAEGAVEALAKPAGPYSVGDLRMTLADKIRAAAAARVRRRPEPQPAAPPAPEPARKPEPQPAPPPAVKPVSLIERAPAIVTPVSETQRRRNISLIAIGASTGGTEAIREVLERFPADTPPVVITQHMPAGFTKAFAERLNRICPIEVKEAEDGDEIRQGRALVAPGGFHLMIRRRASGWVAQVKDGPRVCYQKPSVDVLFASVAAEAGAKALGIILTGMGSDGAAGMLKMRQAGSPTIAQDEKSCVVFGMPREAIRVGAAEHVVSLERVAAKAFAIIADKPQTPAG